MAESGPISVLFENSQPILRVENMEASLRFYVDLLGFRNADWGSDDFTCISRQGAVMYLVPRRPGARWRMGMDGSGGRGKTP